MHSDNASIKKNNAPPAPSVVNFSVLGNKLSFYRPSSTSNIPSHVRKCDPTFVPSEHHLHVIYLPVLGNVNLPLCHTNTTCSIPSSVRKCDPTFVPFEHHL